MTLYFATLAPWSSRLRDSRRRGSRRWERFEFSKRAFSFKRDLSREFDSSGYAYNPRIERTDRERLCPRAENGRVERTAVAYARGSPIRRCCVAESRESLGSRSADRAEKKKKKKKKYSRRRRKYEAERRDKATTIENPRAARYPWFARYRLDARATISTLFRYLGSRTRGNFVRTSIEPRRPPRSSASVLFLFSKRFRGKIHGFVADRTKSSASTRRSGLERFGRLAFFGIRGLGPVRSYFLEEEEDAKGFARKIRGLDPLERETRKISGRVESREESTARARARSRKKVGSVSSEGYGFRSRRSQRESCLRGLSPSRVCTVRATARADPFCN